jgi:hypothetical protein
MLTGTNLEKITQVEVQYKGRPTRDVQVELQQMPRGATRASQRNLKITARAGIQPGTYALFVREDVQSRLIQCCTFDVVIPTLKPGVTHYYIANYRLSSDVYLINEGVLDPSTLVLLDNDAGHVWIEGQNLNQEGIEIYLRPSPGEEYSGQILEKTSQGNLDKLKVKFSELRAGWIHVKVGSEDVALSPKARRFSYRLIDAPDLQAFLGNSSIVIGNPQGEGTVTMIGSEEMFSVDSYQNLGLNLEINDLRSQSMGVSFHQHTQNNWAILRLTIDFETSGREATGSFVETISGFGCASYRVPYTACNGINISCFLSVVGGTLASLGSCANPANWQSTSWPGPNIPVDVDLTGPQLTVDINLARTNGGNIAGAGVEATFTTQNMTVSSNGTSLPLNAIQDWILGEINTSLNEEMGEMGLDTSVAEFLNNLLGLAFDGRIEGLGVTDYGRLFVDMHQL